MTKEQFIIRIVAVVLADSDNKGLSIYGAAKAITNELKNLKGSNSPLFKEAYNKYVKNENHLL